MAFIREVVVANKTIKLEFNRFAKQANGSVMVTCGDTQVLCCVTASDEPKEGQDFFPLTVDYVEKYYAAGRIPGGFLKREGKLSDLETLTSRVIDRPLRPCFPETFRCDTHVVCTVVSLDPANHPAPLALLGASAALMVSDIPFDGPVASVRLGMKDGQYIVDPTDKDGAHQLDLNIACKPDAVLMVEAGAEFLSEEQMLDAINHAHKLMKPLFDVQVEAQREIGKAKREIKEPAKDQALFSKIEGMAIKRIAEGFVIKDKLQRRKALSSIDKDVNAALNTENDPLKKKQIAGLLEEMKYHWMRSLILNEKRRIDGRKLDEIRPITCDTAVLRRPHGSSLFTRGETQALASCTLGGGDDEQRIDSITNPGATKRFLLHYNFPGFAVGEVKPLRGPGRREIGHGALAERALAQVLPDAKKFGYTIRLVSEILESNGSSSMATVCSGTMAMLDAGVPIKDHVAGIAMGLIKEGDKFSILSDILGDEDHLGDMDFKVCGTAQGITALQMDIKIGGLSREIMHQALIQARAGLNHILGKLKTAIEQPKELSDYAPRIFQIKIPADRVRDLIGPGGKMIKRIVADTGVKIDVVDDGMVTIMSPDVSSAEAAKQMVRSATSDPDIGAIYLGTVKKIMDFGAFVEIKPGVEGLCHISQLAPQRVAKVEDICKEGEEMLVKVLEIDRQGKIKLSRKEALGKKPTA